MEETADQQLAEVRKHIDSVDEEILMLLHERAAHVEQVARIKSNYKIDAVQPARYEQLLKRLHAKARELGLKEELVDEIWSAIHKHSVARQEEIL